MDEKYNIKGGMLEIAPGRYVNPQYASEGALATAKYNTTPGAASVDRNGLINDYGAKINSATLSAPTTPVSLPTQTPTLPPSSEIIANANVSADAFKTAQDETKAAYAGVDQVQAQRNSLLDTIKSAFGLKTDAYNQAKVDDAATDSFRKDLTGINTDIANTTVELRGIQDQIKGRGDITQEAQQGLLSGAQDKYGRILADLSIRQSAANQNIAQLEKSADRKLQLAIAPIDNDIKYLTDYALKNNEILTATEKEKVTALIAAKNKEKDRITAEQGVATTALMKASENGVKIPDSVVSQVLANPKDTYTILARNGVSLQNPLDLAYKQAQINSLNAAAASKSASGATGGGVSQELQDAINNGTIDPNKINSRTLGIYNDIAKAGVDAVGAHAGAAGETKAITDLSSYKSTATRTLAVLESNLPLVENLADTVNTIGVPALDAYVTGKKALLTNDPNVVKYVNSLKTLRAEYAQMLAKGNVATEGDKEDAAQAIPAGLSSAAYAALGDQLKIEARNILAASDQAIQAAKNKSASNTGGYKSLNFGSNYNGITLPN